MPTQKMFETLATDRFALLWHDLSDIAPAGRKIRQLPDDSHWDLLLQLGDVLKTWSLDVDPWTLALGSADLLEALQRPDHRLEYLEYEGPVSGDRGIVRRTRQGSLRWLSCRDETVRVELISGSNDNHLAETVRFELTRNDATRWTLQRFVE